MEAAFMTKTGFPQKLEVIKKKSERIRNETFQGYQDFYAGSTALKNTVLPTQKITSSLLKGAFLCLGSFKRRYFLKKQQKYRGEFANAFKVPSQDFTEFVPSLS